MTTPESQSAGMDEEELAEIEARLQASGPGQWMLFSRDGSGDEISTVCVLCENHALVDGAPPHPEIPHCRRCVFRADVNGFGQSGPERHAASGQFIVDARQDIPRLSGEVRRLRAENALLRAAHDIRSELP